MEKKILFATIVLAISITAAAIAGPPEILSVYGTAPKTARITVTDTSQLLSTAFAAAYSGTDPVWANVKAITISCENNNSRLAFTANSSLVKMAGSVHDFGLSDLSIAFQSNSSVAGMASKKLLNIKMRRA